MASPHGFLAYGSDIEQQPRDASPNPSNEETYGDTNLEWRGKGFENGDTTEVVTYSIPEDRKLGYWSTAGLIANRMIGTGIFSTPATVLLATGSTGANLIMWAAGAVLAWAGLTVYLEFGLAIPRSGGEKNYVERVYRNPAYLATCVYGVLFVALANTAGNAVSFSHYLIRACQPHKYARLEDGGFQTANPPEGLSKGLGILCITVVCLIHLFFPKFGGKYLMSGLATMKVMLLLLVIGGGIAALAGAGPGNPRKENFMPSTAFAQDPQASAGSYAVALLQISYSYRGWENANYALGEVKNPNQTLKRSAILATLLVAVLYILCIVAYTAALSKDVIEHSGLTIAANFFLDVYGNNGFSKTFIPLCISISAFGNVLAVTFANSRVKQEIAKEGVLPFSSFWSKNVPRFNSPGPALFLHWAVSVLVISIPSSDDAYNLVVLLFTYAQTVVGVFIGAGLLWLTYGNEKEVWILQEATKYRTWPIVTALFTVSNIFLVVAPFLQRNDLLTGSIPYWVFPVVVLAVLLVGVIYWFGFAKLAPLVGYEVQVERTFDDSGIETVKYKHIRPYREGTARSSSTTWWGRHSRPSFLSGMPSQLKKRVPVIQTRELQAPMCEEI